MATVTTCAMDACTCMYVREYLIQDAELFEFGRL